MSKVFCTAFLLLAGFGWSPLGAHPLKWNGRLTREQVIARARRSFDARLAAVDVEIASAQARNARARAMPSISLGETAMNSTLVQLGMPVARQTYTSVRATVPLFAPQAWLRARVAGTQAIAARAAAAMRVNLAVAVALRRFDAAALAAAIARERGIDVADQRSHLSFTRDRVRAGAAPRYLVARDQAALEHARQTREDARARAVRALHALELALDMDMASRPSVALPAPVNYSPDVSSLEQRAYAQRPDAIAARQAVLAAQQRIAAARGAYLPAVSLNVQTYNGFSTPPLGGEGSQISISASLPLFDGGSRGARLHLAQDNYDRAVIAWERTRLQAQADVLDAVALLRAAKRNLATAKAELANANVELRIAELRERAGKGIELETLDALAALASAREDQLRATAGYDDALTALHAAVGDYAPATQ